MRRLPTRATKGPNRRLEHPRVPAAEVPRPNRHRAREFPTMTEGELTEEIRKECVRLNLRRYHVGNPVGTNAGWPDEPIIGPGGFLIREVKGSNGHLEVAQLDCLNALRAVGIDADLWWPEDWHLGYVTAQLETIARPRPGIIVPLPPLTAATPARPLPPATPTVAGGRKVLRPGHRWCGCKGTVGDPHQPDCVWAGNDNSNPWKTTNQ